MDVVRRADYTYIHNQAGELRHAGIACTCRHAHRLADENVLPTNARAGGDEAVIIQLVITAMAHAC
jgi:hypothetical protein